VASPRYLAKYGAAVIGNGYEIIPIKPGTKRPPFDEWEKIRADAKQLKRWLDHGRESNGIGILSRKTPMVDIDCRDPAIVKAMVSYTTKLLGPTLQRIGLAPKTGLLYRTNKPWPKVNSKTFVDPDDKGDKPTPHKLEVLGDGQQFVAYAIHPDTGEPYRWIDKEGPHNAAWDELPEITREDAEDIAAEFERLMLDAGYVVKRGSALARLSDRRKTAELEDDDDDEFASDVQKIELTTQELSVKLGLVPGADDYETWLQIGMALWHQYDGDDEGLILWHEWSAQASNYDSDVLDEKWPTFEIEGKGRRPVTARLILKLSGEEEKRVAGEKLDETRERLVSVRKIDDLLEIAREIKRTPFEPLIRDNLAALMRKRYKDITGETMTAARAAGMLRFENPDNKRAPKWLEPYVYIERLKVFYNRDNGTEIDAEAFNAKHNRFMMTQKDRLEGRSAPEHTASSASLNLWEIDTVWDRMYMPHEDDFFTYNGRRYVNFYSETGVPDMPKRYNDDEKVAIKRVQAHVRHLFADERSWKLLLDWLAYIVQERRRIAWMPLIQGTEGDGKTFFAKMLKVVLGWENVHIVPGEALEEKYNHFMEGALLVFFEEVRLHGKNRYEALNRMKPWITNESLSIRAMHRGSYEIVNTASILGASNHKDCLPAGENDTRYFPLFSRWQTKTAIDSFNRLHPNYYTELYGALDHAGALRKWLLNYEISEDFNPDARAPESAYRAEMIALNQSDEEEAFAESLTESKRRDYSSDLLDATVFSDVLEEKGAAAPYGKALKRFLAEHGFTKLPQKVRIGEKVRSFWTRTPERWIIDGKVDHDAVRDYLDPL
jgi:hypothetical protein